MTKQAHTRPPAVAGTFYQGDPGRMAGEIAAMLQLAPLDEFEQACGALPMNGMIEVARRRGLRPSLLGLRNSGDTALAFAEPLRGEMSRG